MSDTLDIARRRVSVLEQQCRDEYPGGPPMFLPWSDFLTDRLAVFTAHEIVSLSVAFLERSSWLAAIVCQEKLDPHMHRRPSRSELIFASEHADDQDAVTLYNTFSRTILDAAKNLHHLYEIGAHLSVGWDTEHPFVDPLLERMFSKIPDSVVAQVLTRATLDYWYFGDRGDIFINAVRKHLLRIRNQDGAEGVFRVDRIWRAVEYNALGLVPKAPIPHPAPATAIHGDGLKLILGVDGDEESEDLRYYLETPGSDPVSETTPEIYLGPAAPKGPKPGITQD